MEDEYIEEEIPCIVFTIGISDTEEDARRVGSNLIRNALNIEHFKILEVKLQEQGFIKTKNGTVSGRRYSVAFRETGAIGNVVYVHPDYKKLLNQ